MKYLLISIIFLLTLNIDVYGQTKIGDLEIESMESFFNPSNKTYWGKKKMGVHRFNERISDIWVNSEMSGFIRKSKYIEKDMINLQASTRFDKDEIQEKLKNQFSEQFGEPIKYTIDTPMISGTGGSSESLKWVFNEDNQSYEILLGSFGSFTIVSISEIEQIPDF